MGATLWWLGVRYVSVPMLAALPKFAIRWFTVFAVLACVGAMAQPVVHPGRGRRKSNRQLVLDAKSGRLQASPVVGGGAYWGLADTYFQVDIAAAGTIADLNSTWLIQEDTGIAYRFAGQSHFRVGFLSDNGHVYSFQDDYGDEFFWVDTGPGWESGFAIGWGGACLLYTKPCVSYLHDETYSAVSAVAAGYGVTMIGGGLLCCIRMFGRAFGAGPWFGMHDIS